MNKVLVTGGAGFIGSNLVDELLVRYPGIEIIVVDNKSAKTNSKFYWNKKCYNYTFDICDYDKIRQLFRGVDVVFHLAAEARIQPAIQNPLLATKTNVLGTTTILQCAREAGVKRVIYSSTSSAYGMNPFPQEEIQAEDSLNPYSVSKVAGEKMCKMYSRLFGLETVIFRYFNVYGDRQPLNGQYAPVIGIFQRQKSEGRPLTIVGDGLQRRDFTHVNDIVDANIRAAITENKVSGELVNLGTGINHSILEIAEMIGGETIHIPPRTGESRITLAHVSKARELLGWSAKIRLEDWVKLGVD